MSADWGSFSDWGGGNDDWNWDQPIQQPVAPPQQNYSNFDQYNEYQPPVSTGPVAPVAPEMTSRDYSNGEQMGPSRDLMGNGPLPGNGIQFDDEGNPMPVGTNEQGQVVDQNGNVLKGGQGGTPYQLRSGFANQQPPEQMGNYNQGQQMGPPSNLAGNPNQSSQPSFLDSISKYFGGGKSNNSGGSGGSGGGGGSAMDWLLPLLGGAAAAYAIPKLTGTGTGSNQTFTPPNYADQFKNFTPPNFTPLPAVQVGSNAGMQMQAPQFNTLKNLQLQNPGAQMMASGPVAPRG